MLASALPALALAGTVQRQAGFTRSSQLAASLQLFHHEVAFPWPRSPARFLRPLYRALNNSKSEAARQLAVDTFKQNRNAYHPIASKMASAAACKRGFVVSGLAGRFAQDDRNPGGLDATALMPPLCGEALSACAGTAKLSLPPACPAGCRRPQACSRDSRMSGMAALLVLMCTVQPLLCPSNSTFAWNFNLPSASHPKAGRPPDQSMQTTRAAWATYICNE